MSVIIKYKYDETCDEKVKRSESKYKKREKLTL